jgi:hypothetical protein
VLSPFGQGHNYPLRPVIAVPNPIVIPFNFPIIPTPYGHLTPDHEAIQHRDSNAKFLSQSISIMTAERRSPTFA